MSLRTRLIRQFRQPHGPLGRLAGLIMATRPSNRERNRWTLALLELRPTDHVLELGFGPGYAIAEAARVLPQGIVYGIDHSDTMLAQASARNAQAIRRGQVRLCCGDAADLAWLPAPVDKIWSNNVVQFWSDPAAVFTTLLRASKPGGRVATAYQPRHRNATAADSDGMAASLQGILERCGYVDIRVERLPLDPPVICVLARKPADH